jgi:hypothetical protein
MMNTRMTKKMIMKHKANNHTTQKKLKTQKKTKLFFY